MFGAAVATNFFAQLQKISQTIIIFIAGGSIAVSGKNSKITGQPHTFKEK